MAENLPASSNGLGFVNKKRIILNAFEMSTVGHMSPGQWKDPEDRSATKRTLYYWINLAQILERGDINALFLADTYGGHDTYEGSLDNCIRRAAQWPVTDPSIAISAMAAVTKNLAFAITYSTSFEPPFLLAKRLSTLDHLTAGRVGWNIVTGWKKGAFKAIGLDEPMDHDRRYAQADEYVRVLYKLWEGSWADDALVQDASADIFTDPAKVRTIKHQGEFYHLESKHIVDPSPQRTPLLFQAGTSPAGSHFGATHAEGIFVAAHSASVLAPRVAKMRELAQNAGRDPQSLKFFASFTPFIGVTEEEAKAKYERAKKYTSTIGGLVLFSGWTGIDLSQVPLDEEIDPIKHSVAAHKITSTVEMLTARSPDLPSLTPRLVGEMASIGGLGPVAIGTAAQVADVMEAWINEADIDGFNLAYVTAPGTFEDVVDLLVPELRRRGLYPAKAETADPLTARERLFGKGHSRLGPDHVGSRYKYDVYKDPPFSSAD
ncbi:Xenobiotic compound monooxygenase DszA family [Penicillium longicatenatum]|uniref:Xenobiotic compound monooxygenase DszA family n=1 Tax=Penicillium longicatenatum TaxID=1561947 RepID=UPI0025486BA4|nr:Xenobiotic compound monooxygenase DszA family [Penicillium longicatenatum]KAJ5642856.1 Xenobiotic compound monooxygenase DszA family [Penicillium longicatenatum]